MSGASRSRARRALIVHLARQALEGLEDPVVVDVGSDHGLVARELCAIASERWPSSLSPTPDLPRVVADGLAPYRRVDLAVVTGMGPALVARILRSGPEVPVAVVHSPDRTDELRQRLHDTGWRIEAEALAPEGPRYAEVLRVVPGTQPESRHALWFGPRLGQDPHLADHTRRERARWAALAARIPPDHPNRAHAEGWVAWLDGRLALLSRP